MHVYSDPSLASDPHALPDVEVFMGREVDGLDEYGWYYWYCFPGCLPDSEPHGPFDTPEAAIADAQDAH